jgi:hypothetical protein
MYLDKFEPKLFVDVFVRADLDLDHRGDRRTQSAGHGIYRAPLSQIHRLFHGVGGSKFQKTAALLERRDRFYD